MARLRKIQGESRLVEEVTYGWEAGGLRLLLGVNANTRKAEEKQKLARSQNEAQNNSSTTMSSRKQSGSE